MSSPKQTDTPPEFTTELEEIELTDADVPKSGCGILGRYPVISVLAFAIAGVAVGVGLSTWEPEDPEDKDTTVQWLGLIGDMFIRLLKAVVLPLVFVNVILSIVDMMNVGRASTVGVKTIGLYLFTTLIASIIGIISIMVFKGLFKTEEIETNSQTRVQLGCEAEDSFLAHDGAGSVFCSANLTEGMSNYFSIEDIDGTFIQTASGPAELSFSDTIYDGVFGKMITSNIFGSFVEANFAAVVLFAIFMGAALSKSLFKKKMRTDDSIFIQFLKEVDGILITMIHWIILITPFAVFSLISRYVPFSAFWIRSHGLSDCHAHASPRFSPTSVLLVPRTISPTHSQMWLTSALLSCLACSSTYSLSTQVSSTS